LPKGGALTPGTISAGRRPTLGSAWAHERRESAQRHTRPRNYCACTSTGNRGLFLLKLKKVAAWRPSSRVLEIY
jgi:hypothetical protein